MSPRAATPTTPLDALVRDAEQAVARLESLPPDVPWADPLAAADRAIDALHGAAHVAVFPRALTPLSASTVTDLHGLLEDSTVRTLVRDLLEVHGAALEHHTELAVAIRGVRGRRFLAAAGIPDEQVAAFDQAIAAQLAAANQLQPHSGALAETVPALRARLQAVRETRQAAAQAAIDAAAETDVEIARVRAEAFERRRQELAARAERLPGSRLLVLPGELDPITARLLAHHLARAESADRLDLLERAIESVEASR